MEPLEGPLAPLPIEPVATSNRPFVQSITDAGVAAGVEAARRDHEAQKELGFGASTAKGGTVKLSFAGRWKHVKAALFGEYSHDEGAAAGIEGAYSFGGPPQDMPPATSTTPDPRYPQ